MPEETELLDDAFLRDFCLETAPERVDGAFALRFRPLQQRETGYGIRGTIWLEDSFLIRRLELDHLRGDSALIKTRVDYADIAVDGSSIRLRANGEAAGRPEELAMVNWVRGTCRFTYAHFQRVGTP